VKILDAFSTAVTFGNVYLDSSFSIPYWSGSSLVQDYAFAMEKMEMEKWMWGTDMPYMPLSDSISSANEFLDEYDLGEYEKEYFHTNAEELLDL
jgi:predicted TIM-barrel fold metal-dependent hydrolase